MTPQDLFLFLGHNPNQWRSHHMGHINHTFQRIHMFLMQRITWAIFVAHPLPWFPRGGWKP